MKLLEVSGEAVKRAQANALRCLLAEMADTACNRVIHTVRAADTAYITYTAQQDA